MRFLLLLAALLLLAPKAWAAPDDTCTIQGACTLDSITDSTCTGGGTISCTGGDTNPGADDLFVVDTGGEYPRFAFTVTETVAGEGGYQIRYTNPVTGVVGVTPVMPVTDSDANDPYREHHIRRYLVDALGYDFVINDCPAATNCATSGNTLEWTMTGTAACGTTIQASDFECIPQANTNCGGGTGVTVSAASVVNAGVAPTTDATLTIGGDWTFDGTTTGTGIQVKCSDATFTGQLAVVHSDSLHGIDVTLPSGITTSTDGKIVSPRAIENEGTFTVQGAWYDASSGTAQLVADIADADNYEVGEIIPCPDHVTTSGDIIAGGCDATGTYDSSRYVGIRWTSEYEMSSNGGTDSPYYEELVERLQVDIAAGDSVFATFPDTSFGVALDLPNDAWAYYRVAAADGPSATAPYYVIIDLYPGDLNPFYYPQSRIALNPGTARVDANRGETQVEVTATTLSAGTTDTLDYSGRWIRFEDENTSGRWECAGYPIGRIADHSLAGTTGDVVILAGDKDFNDGFRRDIAATDNYVIDYGWKCGEPIAFGNFPRFASATTAGGSEFDDSHIVSAGGILNWSGAYTEDLWGITTIAGDADVAYTVNYGVAANSANGLMWDFFNVASPTLGPGLHIAGGANANTHKHYGVRVADSGVLTVRDFDIRHTGDDSVLAFAFNASDVVTYGWEKEKTGLIRLLRGSVSWHADSDDSTAILDMPSSSASVQVKQFLSRGASDYRGLNALFRLGEHQSCLFEDVTILGSKSPVTSIDSLFGTNTRDGCRSNNYALMFFFGDNNGTVNPTAGSLYPPGDVTDWVARNIWTDDSSISPFSKDTGSMRDGYIKTAHFTVSTEVPQKTGARIENVGLFDMRDHALESTPSNVVGELIFNGDGAAEPERYSNSSAIFTNITVANYPYADLMSGSADVDNTNARSGLYMRSSPTPVGYPQLRNVAVAYWDPTEANNGYGGMRFANGTTSVLTLSGIWCVFGNYGGNPSVPTNFHDNATADELADNVLSGYLQNVDPRFFDPKRGQWWPVEGSPWQVANCGMQRGAGLGKKLHGAKLLDLHQEVQDDVGREQVGSGSVYGPMNQTTYGSAFGD